jgi:putative two-component system response regulator
MVEGQSPIGVMQVINRRGPEGATPFSPADLQVARALASMAAILVRNAQLRSEVQRLHLDTIFRLATAAEFRDGETGAHIQRVSMYSEILARQLGMPAAWCQTVLFAAPMHDVGKLGVPDAILQKPGPLTPEERASMQRHAVIGAQILSGSPSPLLQTAERIALTHHERWDGRGYPNGLSGAAIPIEGRITSVADVFDALTSARPYKKPIPFPRAVEMVREGRGTQFDPAVIDALDACIGQIEEIHLVYRDLGPIRNA